MRVRNPRRVESRRVARWRCWGADAVVLPFLVGVAVRGYQFTVNGGKTCLCLVSCAASHLAGRVRR